jgi:hypothetical protein
MTSRKGKYSFLQGTFGLQIMIPDMFFIPSSGKKVCSTNEPASIHNLPERGLVRGDKEFREKYPLILSLGNRNLYYTHSQHRRVRALKSNVSRTIYRDRS